MAIRSKYVVTVVFTNATINKWIANKSFAMRTDHYDVLMSQEICLN